MRKSDRIIRRPVLLIAIALLLAVLSVTGASAAITVANSKTLLTSLGAGAYRIKNKYSGTYLDTYDIKYDSKGTAYLDAASGNDGQNIAVVKNDDGSYFLYPQSDSGKYALSSAADSVDGTKVTKSSASGNDLKYDIIPLGNGEYTIAPVYSANRSLVLSYSEDKTRHGFSYIVTKEYEINDSKQVWIFEPILPSAITLSAYSERVKTGTENKLYARFIPTYTTAAVTWVSSDPSKVSVNPDGSFYAVANGKAVITAISGNMSASCTVEVSDENAFTWYSQHNIYYSYWNSVPVQNITFISGERRLYAVDRYNRNLDWMDEGCALTCVAIVLRNMGATMTTGYDLRSGQTTDIIADPYTVSLANSGNAGAYSGTDVLYGNPILVSTDRITSRFTVGGKQIYVDTYYYVTPSIVKEALDKNPAGVIVGFYNARYESHYIVFNKCTNPDAKNANSYEFIVSDPAAYDAGAGDCVSFKSSYSYVSLGYNFYNSMTMQVWYTK